MSSDAKAAQQRVEQLDTKIGRYSLWGAVGIIVAIVGLLIAAIVASPSVVSLLVQTQSIANQAQDQMSEIDATAHKLAQQNQDLQNQITNLKKKVDLIDGKGGAQRKNTDVSRPRPNR